ncbi:MAG TPA: response regulator transcription factor, partial [Actinomycetota bacterium]|nr:response regulator transcription factor [Actinomycetota bacterium]
LAARDGGGPGQAAELAWHWYAAHDLERALPAAVEAGRAAERAYAFAEAQRQFERALELWERAGGPQGGVGMDKAELLARAGEAAANAGASDRAVALVRGALAEVDAAADPLLAGQLTERLAFHLRVAGRPGAFEAYQEAVRLVPPGPTVARARVLAGLGQALMLRARFAESVATCQEAIEVARAAGSRVVEAHALNSLGTAMARLDKDHPEAGLAHLWEARRRAAELGAAKDESRACVNLSDLLEDLGRLEEAVAVAMEGIEVARAAGLARTFGAFLAGNAASALYNLGRWDESARISRASLELGDDEDLNTVTLRQSMAVLDAGRGEFASALAHVRAARRLSGDEFIAVQYPPVLAAARHDTATLADARLVADGLARWSGETLAGSAVAWRRALLATCEAEKARVDGEAGPERWLAAVAAWEEASHPYPLATTRWRAAEALLSRRGGRRDRPLAAELLRQGHATATELGARPLRTALERLARLGRVELVPDDPVADGQAPGSEGAGAEPAAALGLTARELEVLALVAEGRSNRQVGDALFISAKTASVHVSNILAKLGVASRVEAAAVAHRLGLLDQRSA